MSPRKSTKAVECLTEDDLTKDDWCALYMARELFNQIARYGHGKRTLMRFAQAIVEGADNG